MPRSVVPETQGLLCSICQRARQGVENVQQSNPAVCEELHRENLVLGRNGKRLFANKRCGSSKKTC